MRDYALFVIAPYVCVTAFGIACAMRLMSARRADVGPQHGTRAGMSRVAWRIALAVVATGHLAALLAPDAVLQFTRQEARLVTLELAGVAFGIVALAGAAL